jgi:hypothetical protein
MTYFDFFAWMGGAISVFLILAIVFQPRDIRKWHDENEGKRDE